MAKTNMTEEWMEAYDRMGLPTGIEESRCPVCGARDIDYDETDLESANVVNITYICGNCGSEFSMQYGFEGVFVHKDGRFED